MAMVLAMGSMTACGGGSDTPATGGDTPSGDAGTQEQVEAKDIKLTVWAPQEEQTDYSAVDAKYGDHLLKYMCEAFDEAHPEWNIEFDYKVCSEGDAYSELSKDAAAGGDVFMFAGDQTASLVSEGILNPLAGTEEVAANNGERAMAAATVDGMVYGIPFTPNTWFMYYDKSKYTEDEVKSLDTMMAKEIEGCDYNFSIQLGNGWYNGGFFYTAGCTVFGPDGTKEDECDFNSANGVEAAKVMLGLATSKKFLKDDGQGIAIANMKEGKLAAMCSGTWDAASVKEALGDNYAATKLPTITINGEEKQMNSIGDFKYIGVNANIGDEDKVKAAQALAIWLGSEQCQLDRFLARGISPTWASLAENEAVKADVATTALALQNQFTVITPATPKFNSNYWSNMEALGNGMVNGDVNEKNLQKQLDSVVENIVTDIASN